MTLREVRFSERAEQHLDGLYEHIERQSGASRADAFVSGIVAYCHGLALFPERGTRRDDVRPGTRILGYRRSIAIAFTVEPEGVTILGVYYGGRDHEADLREPER